MSDRLLLRQINMNDLDAFFKLDSDEDILRYIGIPPVQNIEESKARIESLIQEYEKYKTARLAVIDKSNSEFMGWCGLKYYPYEVCGVTNFYDLGYRFLKEYWGQGFATESSVICLKEGFERLQISEVYASAELRHNGSVNVLIKLGFEKIDQYWEDGQLVGFYRLLKSDFENKY